ncbi:MAG: hypothetical protein Q4Q42_06990 [Planctomycetia bacterium]|nr:hypothetical protein [Planctomycetia bacterium]
MSFNLSFQKRVTSSLMAALLTTCCFLFNATTRADESSPKVVASVVCPSVDSVFKGAGIIANEMKYNGFVETARLLAKSRGCFDVLDPSRSFGYVLATDDNTVFPFFFFPVKDVEKNNEEALNAAIAPLVEKIANDRIPQELIPDAGFLVDDVFVVTQQEFKERAQAIPQNEYLDSIQKDSGVLLTVKVNLSALPKELIEAVSSLARQKLAESLPDDDENKLKAVEDSLANLSDLLNSIQALQYDLEVSSESALVSTFKCAFVPDSKIAEHLQKTSNAATRWNAISATPNTILVSVEAGEEYRATGFDFDNIASIIHDNINQGLDALADKPAEHEVAVKVAALFEKALLAQIKTPSYDRAFAITNEPLTIVCGSNCADPENLKEGVKQLVDEVAKKDEKISKCLSSEEVEGFQVTSFKIALSDIVKTPQFPLPTDKDLVAKIGVSSDSALLLLGIDSENADAQFKRIADASKTREKSQYALTIDYVQIAKLAKVFLKDNSGIHPIVKQIVDKFANAENVRTLVSNTYQDNTLTCQSILTKEFFGVCGDVVRTQLKKNLDKGDAGKDLDELFEEE